MEIIHVHLCLRNFQTKERSLQEVLHHLFLSMLVAAGNLIKFSKMHLIFFLMHSHLRPPTPRTNQMPPPKLPRALIG